MEIIFTPYACTGNDGLLVQHLGLLAGAEHDRNVGAVHVSVEQADRGAEGFERDGEVYRDGGLAHATLAAGHRDQLLNARDRRSFGWAWRGRCGTRRFAGLIGHPSFRFPLWLLASAVAAVKVGSSRPDSPRSTSPE